MEFKLPEDNLQEAIYWLLIETYNERKIQGKEELLTKRFIQDNFCKHFPIKTAQKQMEDGLEWLCNYEFLKFDEKKLAYDTTILGDRLVEKFFSKIKADLVDFQFISRYFGDFDNNYLTQIHNSGNSSIQKELQGDRHIPTLQTKIEVALNNIFKITEHIEFFNRMGITVPTIFEIASQFLQSSARI